MQIVTIFFLQQYSADIFDFTYFKNKTQKSKRK